MKQSSTYRVILSIIWVILVIILPVFKNLNFVFTNTKKILVWILTANNHSPNWEYKLFFSDQFDRGLLTDLQACVTELVCCLDVFLGHARQFNLTFPSVVWFMLNGLRASKQLKKNNRKTLRSWRISQEWWHYFTSEWSVAVGFVSVALVLNKICKQVRCAAQVTMVIYLSKK